MLVDEYESRNSRTIRVLVAEDYALAADAIRTLLGEESSVEIVGEAGTAEDTLRQAKALQPDVVVISAGMSDPNGADLVRQIRSVSSSVAVVVMGGSDGAGSVVASLKAGATGYLARSSRGEQLINALHCVHGGGFSLHQDVAQALLDCFDCVFARMMGDQAAATLEARRFLSEREFEILNLVAHGRSNQEIALELHLSQRTIQAHVSSILKKTNTNSRLEVVLVSLCKGWLTLDQIRQGLRVFSREDNDPVC